MDLLGLRVRHEQLVACAQEQAQASGGITADIFAHAVAPLLAYSCQTRHGASDRAAVLTGLVPLRACGAAPADRSSSSSHSLALLATMDSPAACCAMDLLCLIFAQLPMPDFFRVIRTCRSWRAVRLYAVAWPSVGDAAVLAHMLQDKSPAVQLHALRCLHTTLLSGGKQVFPTALLQRLVQLLGSADAHLQVSTCCTLYHRCASGWC